jgi:hypothetical protein
MAKQTLTGTLDEQCEFLYNLAQEKLAQGNYTGATYALKEILKYAPDYRDASALLAEAKRRKSAQTMLLMAAMVGSAVFIGIGTLLRLRNDFLFLGLAVVGALVGYTAGVLLQNKRRQAA